MHSFLNDAWYCFCRAEEARSAAERLTDPEAKEVMRQLGHHYDCKARAAIAQATASELALRARCAPLE